MRRHWRWALLWVWVWLGMSGWAVGQDAGVGQDAVVARDEASYVLRPNDLIKLDVFEEADLSVQVRILKSGQATFQLIGPVTVSGLSVSEASEKIRQLYISERYLRDPKVTLTVEEYATEFVLVTGAVRMPGQVPILNAGGLDLAGAMAAVGGLTESADPNGIQLRRESGGISTYGIGEVQNGQAGRIKLQSGDRIIVNQSVYVGKQVSVLGRVGRPGPVAFPLNGSLDLVNAIAIAGGLTEMANPKKISINRKGKVTVVDYRQITERADRPYRLEPGDIITVPERIF